MTAKNIIIANKIYQDQKLKNGRTYKYLMGVWFEVRLSNGECEHHYLDRDIYNETSECVYAHPDYQPALDELSDDELCEAFFERYTDRRYWAKMEEQEEFENKEFWASEAQSPKGFEECFLPDEEWEAEIAINELKAAA